MAGLNHQACGELDLRIRCALFSEHYEQDEEPDLNQENAPRDGEYEVQIARQWKPHGVPRVSAKPQDQLLKPSVSFGSGADFRSRGPRFR